jgi:lactoylglutathione lyase
MQLTYAIVFVADMSRSVSFYRDIVGLSLKFESPEWSEFMTGQATLALHLAGASRGDATEGASAAGQCRPGFAVSDLDEFHARMTENGITCIQMPRDVFGKRIAQYTDPDGVVVSVSEDRSQN